MPAQSFRRVPFASRLCADSNVLDWDGFSIHLNKKHVPLIASILRNVSAQRQARMHNLQRRYKRAFVWWRPDGLAYEYTLASLGQRVQQLGLDKRPLSPRA